MLNSAYSGAKRMASASPSAERLGLGKPWCTERVESVVQDRITARASAGDHPPRWAGGYVAGEPSGKGLVVLPLSPRWGVVMGSSSAGGGAGGPPAPAVGGATEVEGASAGSAA